MALKLSHCPKCGASKRYYVGSDDRMCRSCAYTGRKHKETTKKAISLAKLGSLNPMWKGESVKLDALHVWVKNRIPKPLICPKCNTRPTIDLANKGVYDRNLENWEWLCRKCHMESDGRLDNLLPAKKGK